MQAETHDGRSLRILTLIDEHTMQGPEDRGGEGTTIG